MSQAPRPVSRGIVLDAKRDALAHAAREFASVIGNGHGFFAARRELEKAACQFVLAEREFEASPHRKRSVRDDGIAT